VVAPYRWNSQSGWLGMLGCMVVGNHLFNLLF
jgi:hypothetical protein